LPTHYLVSRGFVSPSRNSAPASREIDVLVADPTAAAPWLNESDLVIVPPDSVVAHLHCKTTFARPELEDALQSIDNTQATCEESEVFERIWTAIFFFARGTHNSSDDFLDPLQAAILSGRKEAYLPDFIVVLDGPFIVVDKPTDGRDSTIQLRCFMSGSHSFALALANFFEHIASGRSHRVSDWDNVLGAINIPPPSTRHITR
jgi:hypothetical protein